MERLEFLAALRDSWRQWDDASSDLDDTALLEPGVIGRWSTKDLLGHISAWEKKAIEHVERVQRGEPPSGVGDAGVDAFNERQAALRLEWPLDRVREDFAATRRRLSELISAMTDAEWTAMVDGVGPSRALGEWVGGATNGQSGPGTHAAEHALQLKAWRGRRAIRPGTS